MQATVLETNGVIQIWLLVIVAGTVSLRTHSRVSVASRGRRRGRETTSSVIYEVGRV